MRNTSDITFNIQILELVGSNKYHRLNEEHLSFPRYPGAGNMVKEDLHGT